MKKHFLLYPGFYRLHHEETLSAVSRFLQVTSWRNTFCCLPVFTGYIMKKHFLLYPGFYRLHHEETLSAVSWFLLWVLCILSRSVSNMRIDRTRKSGLENSGTRCSCQIVRHNIERSTDWHKRRQLGTFGISDKSEWIICSILFSKD